MNRGEIERALDGEGEVRFEEPMARHTTLRIGGPAEAWVAPRAIAALQRIRALCAARGLASRAVGAGSNLLVRDRGIRGVVVSTEALRQLEFTSTDDGGATVRVGAGVSTGKLLSEATRRGLGGVEFLGGVPGSVGGGLVMNAGTLLGEFKDVTVRVLSIDETGGRVERDRAACGFVYRGSALPPSEIVVEGELRLAPRSREAIEADVRALRERRRAREPHGAPNAGSIFKNPAGDYAGRLIEQCGLKGRRVGGAEVSAAHANWIVNAGGATARDLLALAEACRAAVRDRFGVTLEYEIKVIGEEDEEAC